MRVINIYAHKKLLLRVVLGGLNGAFFIILCEFTGNSSKIINCPVQSSDIMVTLNILIFVSNSSVIFTLTLNTTIFMEDTKPIIKIGEKGPLIIKGGATLIYSDGRQEIKEKTVALCRCGLSAKNHEKQHY